VSDLAELLKDRYVLERELGRGGMGTVYRARDLKHNRPVALKHLTSDLAEEIGTERFEREIRFAARLQHPHICSVYDSGEVEGHLWFTMPYVDGESLAARLERLGRLPVADALRIAREAAQALAYAHENGIVHRDIKPANLLLARDGSTLVVDFGIARAIGGSRATGEHTITHSGFAPGTPGYMSPEQSAGVADLDGRTDVYSLGLVLYEMLTGERPFGRGELAGFVKLMSNPVPLAHLKRPEIPAAVDEVLKKALAFDPAKRYPMGAFGAELEALRSGAANARASRPLARVSSALRGLFGGSTTTRERPVPAQLALPTSAAVLPFKDLSPEQDQAYFSDGLAEELATALSRIPGLRVVARSSAFQFRGPGLDVREVGRKLRVGAVLGGSVRRSGGRIRVSTNLVSVSDGYELWSDSYDSELADVFQVQEDIARSIAAALRVKLAGPVAALVRRPTADLEAFDLYLKGRFAWHQRTGKTLAEAARYFDEAVARDPGFARAWAGLADACTLLPLYTGTTPAEAWPRAKSAALRAIGLDDGLADAHTSLAYGTMLYEWDWPAAEREFRRAIAADPDYPVAHHWYADFLCGRGRLDEALKEMRRAQELDPLSRITGVELAWVYYLMGRNPEAEAALDQVLRLDPAYSHAHFATGLLALAAGRPGDAVVALRRSLELGGFTAHAAGALVGACAASGDRQAALAELDALTARAATEYVPPFAFVAAYAGMGDLDRAFEWLERGIAERDVLLPENFFEPLLDPLKRDARYARVAARMRGGA
jgi:serine/threonine-protein kinase